MRPSSSAPWAARAAIAVTAALTPFAAQAIPAFAQTLPVSPPPTSVETPAGGTTVGGGGIDLTAGSGDTQVGVGAGPGGVTVRLPGSSSNPGTQPESGRSPSSPTAATPGPAKGKPTTKAPSAGRDEGDGGAGAGGGTNRQATKNGRSRGSAVRESATGTRGDTVSADTVAARTKAKDPNSDLPPVVQFIERIPATVRAGLVALALIAVALWILWVRARRELERNAFVDPASGVSNPPAFVPVLAREIKRAARYGRPFGLVMLEVIDGQGRLSWRSRLTPAKLRRTTRTVAGKVRDADTVVQLARDRFAVLCPEATPASAEALGRNLERCFEEKRVHVKVGTATLRHDDQGPEDLIARALAMAAGGGQEPQAPDRAADTTQPQPQSYDGEGAAQSSRYEERLAAGV